MSRMFEYEENWEEEILTCSECNWNGTFREGDTEMYAEVMDSSCPNCDIILAVVSYPTSAEAAGYNAGKIQFPTGGFASEKACAKDYG